MENYIFAPSLLGPKQDATVALHTCWVEADTQRGDGGVPPPPLMLMVGAMLRRPALDEVREFNRMPPEEVLCEPLDGPWSDPQGDAERVRLRKLIWANDAKALTEVRILTYHACLGSRFWSACGHYNRLLAVHCESVRAACVHFNVTSFLAALKVAHLRDPISRSNAFDENLCFRSSCARTKLPALPPLFALTLEAICACFNPRVPDVKRADRIAAEYLATVRERQASLPMGDVRCLLRQGYASRPLEDVVGAFARHVACGTFTLDAAVRALGELGRGDVAAMLCAPGGAVQPSKCTSGPLAEPGCS